MRYNLLQKADEAQEKLIEFFNKIKQNVKAIHIFFFLIGLHWFSTAGVVYNLITDVPAYGTEELENGEDKYLLIDRNGDDQYSTEGFIAGALTCGASLFFVAALRQMHNNAQMPKILMSLSAACFCVLLIYIMKRIKSGTEENMDDAVEMYDPEPEMNFD